MTTDNAQSAAPVPRLVGRIFSFFRGFIDTSTDPVKHCRVYKEDGCCHVDGLLCDFPKCDILDKHILENPDPPNRDLIPYSSDNAAREAADRIVREEIVKAKEQAKMKGKHHE